MATQTHATENHPVANAGHEDAHHPTERTYWKIFWILFVVTAVEVALYYFELPGPVHVNNGALGALAIAKFIIVAGYFMHLKFDSKLLRRLFVTGLVLAVVVYMIYMLTMGVFVDPVGDRNSTFVN